MATQAKSEIEGAPLAISAVTALEIGILVRRNRLMLAATTGYWFNALVQRLSARVIELPPDLLIRSAEIAAESLSDPFDRIVVATAEREDLTIVTRDRLILAYCQQNGRRCLAC